MRVKTTATFKSDANIIWPLLTNSEMSIDGCFCFGMPRPVSCELPNSEGGVGAERRCTSDRGTITQRITEWDPPLKLRFKMESSNQYWSPCMQSIDERFIISDIDGRRKVTRITTYKATGLLRYAKELVFWIGLKRVHLYVFKNWKAQSEQVSVGNL